MKRRLSAVLGVIVGAALAGGCATLSRDGVSVALVALLPQQASLFETTAALTLRLTNESNQPVALAGASHRLYLNGTYVGRAVSSDPVTIPRLGTATQTVTLHLENLALFRQVAELGRSAQVRYELASRLHPAEGSWRGLRTKASGEIDLGHGWTNRAPVPAR